ncbi:MAG: AhpC/TSA family protein [Prevotellaceae bacterium]|jgi:hypothetical protein|nr:AhpC/TSA family protein [Prevotellaceae bacterium]
MKPILYIIVIAAILCAISCQPTLRISGTAAFDNSITITHDKNNEQRVVATITPYNGEFSHKIKPLDSTEVYLLLTDTKNPMGHFFIVERGHINITIDTTGNVSVTGTELNNKLQDYHNSRNLLFTEFKQLYFPHQEKRAKGKKASEEEIKQIQEEAIVLDSLEKKIIELDIVFTRDNINNVTGQLTLDNLILHSPTADQLKDIIDAANENTRKTASFQRIIDYIHNIEESSLSKSFTDIELLSSFGESVSIASYLKRGKNLLLYIYIPAYFIEYDFIQLNNLYQQYKNDQLIFLCIAISEDRRSWLKLLDKYNIPWTQLIDGSGIDGNLSTKYGISTFPYFILFDKDGIIQYRDRYITATELNEILKK